MGLSTKDGHVAAKLETCGDADDVFVDTRHHRVYVSCGEGVVDVLEQTDTGYRRLARVPTVSGARTSLFDAELIGCLWRCEQDRTRRQRFGCSVRCHEAQRAAAAHTAAAVLACWCSAADAYRPFDGTDAAVAETVKSKSSSARSVPSRRSRAHAARSRRQDQLRLHSGLGGSTRG
jgi:hypothetical protein